MAENVQWIRLKVGMFDGNSFKKIKRAKIGGVAFRDKLTAVWFELLDLAGKSNANGYLVDNNEIPYRSFDDIAVMLDREEKEIELCMQFFINEKMVEIVDDIFCLTNFMQYQNQDGLEKIREQNRERQARFRENQKQKLLELKSSNVTDNVTSRNSSNSKSISNSNSYPILDKYNFSAEVRDSIVKWLNYKKEKKQTYKDIGLTTLLNKLLKQAKDYGDKYVIDSIENSITNNYSGIFPPKETKNGNKTTAKEKPTSELSGADRIMWEEIERVQNELHS